jgi:glutamate/tyrosine decarboxylase-like PLP-dependent enzyme
LSCGEPPISLTSNQTHDSVGKAAQQLDIEARAIATARTGEVDVDHLASVLDEIERDEPNRPILMNVTIGTTQTGALMTYLTFIACLWIRYKVDEGTSQFM